MLYTSFRLHVGTVVRSHGLAGAVKVRLFDSHSDALLHAKRLLLRLKQTTTSQDRLFSFRLVGETLPGQGLIHLQGVSDRNQAELWRNAEVWIDPADLPPLEPDECYLSDLVGFTVDADGKPIGSVTGIEHWGTQSYLVIEGPTVHQALLPAIPAFLQQIDRSQHKIVATVPEGLWEISTKP